MIWFLDHGNLTQIPEQQPRHLPLIFREGGDYALCFSEDAEFGMGGRVDLIPIKIRVRGAYDLSCTNSTESPCIWARSQYCHILQGSYSPAGACTISFDRKPDQGVAGSADQMRISWSDPWHVTHGSDGTVLTVQSRSCQSRSQEGAFLCLNADRCDLGDDSVFLNQQALAPLPRARGDLVSNESFKAYTISVCLCPIVGNCLQPEFFVQEVGIVYFFAAFLCLHSEDAGADCRGSFSSVAALYPIQIHVLCPADVCKTVPGDAVSRVKLVSASADNFRPSWDPTTGCRTAPQTPLQTQPPNCVDPSNCMLSGGTREDVQRFGGGVEGPFRFLGNRPLYGQRAFHSAASLDVCFCLFDCRSALAIPSFFKVGELSIAPLRLLGTSLLLQVPRRVGLIKLRRFQEDPASFQPSPQSVPPAGAHESSYLKLLGDEDLQLRDHDCRSVPYTSYTNQSSREFSLLSVSVSNSSLAQLDELAVQERFRGEPDLENASHLVFGGANDSQTMEFLRPGPVAVCYCGIGRPSGGCEPEFWRLLTHFTVRGPKLSRDLTSFQNWTVSLDVVFSLQLLGWGLVSGDQILILQPGASCLEDWPSVENSILRGCPKNCTAAGGTENNLSTAAVSLLVLDQNSVPGPGLNMFLKFCGPEPF